VSESCRNQVDDDAWKDAGQSRVHEKVAPCGDRSPWTAGGSIKVEVE
jgi:hypothetical protein